jgi:hypothetical protein
MDTYQDQVKAVLATLTDPHTGVNLVESGSFRGAARGGDGAMLDLAIPAAAGTGNCAYRFRRHWPPPGWERPP